MTKCSVRWRPSGGRGEFEFVPAVSLADRQIAINVAPLGLQIDAEVIGRHAQGKPRLRKLRRDRTKLHLPQLVMAVAGLPEPAREDKGTPVAFPLENKQFVMDEMVFEIVSTTSSHAVLSPLSVSIGGTDTKIDLQDRFQGIAEDWKEMATIQRSDPSLAAAIVDHQIAVKAELNSRQIRTAADLVINSKTLKFGKTNAGSAMKLIGADSMPEVDAEQITGVEGRLLTRMHVYRERDRTFSKKVRKYYKSKWGDRLLCVACDIVPNNVYGDSGDSAMEAHHKVPIEQLQPDSVSRVEDMAMLCANCHRVVHSKKPCLLVEDVTRLVTTHRKN